MAHEAIIPAGSAPPLAPYSPGVKVGGTVYVSGVLAMDGDGNIVGEGDIKAKARDCFWSSAFPRMTPFPKEYPANPNSPSFTPCQFFRNSRAPSAS